MKKLLTATAITAVMTSAAWAQEVTVVVPGPSILERIIADAENLSINMLNLSENYSEVTGTTNLEVATGLFDFLTTDIDAGSDTFGLDVSGLIEGFNVEVAEGGGTANALDFGTDGITFANVSGVITALQGVQEDVANVSTTAIGALNTGRIGQFSTNSGTDGSGATSVSTMVFVDPTRIASASYASTSNTQAFSSTFNDQGLTNLANLSGNYASALTSTSNINVGGLVALGEVSTTAIGALNTGDIAASVAGGAAGIASAFGGPLVNVVSSDG